MAKSPQFRSFQKSPVKFEKNSVLGAMRSRLDRSTSVDSDMCTVLFQIRMDVVLLCWLSVPNRSINKSPESSMASCEVFPDSERPFSIPLSGFGEAPIGEIPGQAIVLGHRVASSGRSSLLLRDCPCMDPTSDSASLGASWTGLRRDAIWNARRYV